MCGFDIAKKRASFESEISVLRWCIDGRYKEIDDLKDKIERYQQRLTALDAFEQQLRQEQLIELLRLCNTPCWRYRYYNKQPHLPK